MKHTKITQTERDLIGQWKKERIANKEIARRLGRPVLTIRRELKRNRTRVTVGDHTSGLKRQQVAHDCL